MVVDLQKVQKAANQARKNFIAATNLDLDAYEDILTAYLDDFINAPVERAEKVLKCARDAKEITRSFDKRFSDIVNEVSILAVGQNLAVTKAATGAADQMLEGFGTYLGKVSDALIPGSGVKDIPDETYDQAAVEKIMSQAARLGLANALAQQLAANLVVDHLETIGTFCTEYLREKSLLEALRSLESQEVVEILSEVVIELADIPLVGIFKKIFVLIDKKRARKAGVKPGDTDIMFELDEILSEDLAGQDAVMAVLEEIGAFKSALR
jgi:hypothetical protein